MVNFVLGLLGLISGLVLAMAAGAMGRTFEVLGLGVLWHARVLVPLGYIGAIFFAAYFWVIEPLERRRVHLKTVTRERR